MEPREDTTTPGIPRDHRQEWRPGQIGRTPKSSRADFWIVVGSLLFLALLTVITVQVVSKLGRPRTIIQNLH